MTSFKRGDVVAYETIESKITTKKGKVTDVCTYQGCGFVDVTFEDGSRENHRSPRDLTLVKPATPPLPRNGTVFTYNSPGIKRAFVVRGGELTRVYSDGSVSSTGHTWDTMDQSKVVIVYQP